MLISCPCWKGYSRCEVTLHIWSGHSRLCIQWLCLYSKAYRPTSVGSGRLALESVHLRHSIVLTLNDLPKVRVVGDYKGTWTGRHKPPGLKLRQCIAQRLIILKALFLHIQTQAVYIRQRSFSSSTTLSNGMSLSDHDYA